MKPTSPTWRMADRLLEGRLAERISELRAGGASWDDVSRQLYDAGVTVSTVTLRNWAKQLEVDAA